MDYRKKAETKESQELYEKVLSTGIIPSNANKIECVQKHEFPVIWTLLYKVVRDSKLTEQQVIELLKRKDIAARGSYLNPNNIQARTVRNKRGCVPKFPVAVGLYGGLVLEKKIKNFINPCVNSIKKDKLKLSETTPLHRLMWQITTKEQIDLVVKLKESVNNIDCYGENPIDLLLDWLWLKIDLVGRVTKDANKEIIESLRERIYNSNTNRYEYGLIGHEMIYMKRTHKKEYEFSVIENEALVMLDTVGSLAQDELKELFIYTVKKISEVCPEYWCNKLDRDELIPLYNLLYKIDNCMTFILPESKKEFELHRNLDAKTVCEIKDILASGNVIIRYILKNSSYKKEKIMDELYKSWKLSPSDLILEDMD